MAGPAPKRDSERTRRNVPESGPSRQGELMPVTTPNADRKWHPRAIEWFNSLKTSGQSGYFQQSDWAQAKIVADLLTHVYSVEFSRSAQMIETISSMMGRLGSTEADRRQHLRVELEPTGEETKSVEEMADEFFASMLNPSAAAQAMPDIEPPSAQPEQPDKPEPEEQEVKRVRTLARGKRKSGTG